MGILAIAVVTAYGVGVIWIWMGWEWEWEWGVPHFIQLRQEKLNIRPTE